jgi:hypothetical protein
MGDGGEHAGDGEHERDAVVANGGERAHGAETGHVDDGRAELNGGEHHGGHSEGVEEGNHAEEFVLVFESGVLNAGVDVGLEIFEREHDALGEPARTARVHEDGEVVGFVIGDFGFGHGDDVCGRDIHGGAALGKINQIDDFDPVGFDFAGELRNGDDGVDAAVGDDVGNFAIAEKEIDGYYALASEERSVETRDESRAGGKDEADARTSGRGGEVRGDTGSGGGELFVGSGAGFVAGRDVSGRLLGVSEQRFDEHWSMIALGGRDAKGKLETRNTNDKSNQKPE